MKGSEKMRPWKPSKWPYFHKVYIEVLAYSYLIECEVSFDLISYCYNCLLKPGCLASEGFCVVLDSYLYLDVAFHSSSPLPDLE